jgi:hypothetical protein
VPEHGAQLLALPKVADGRASVARVLNELEDLVNLQGVGLIGELLLQGLVFG